MLSVMDQHETFRIQPRRQIIKRQAGRKSARLKATLSRKLLTSRSYLDHDIIAAPSLQDTSDTFPAYEVLDRHCKPLQKRKREQEAREDYCPKSRDCGIKRQRQILSPDCATEGDIFQKVSDNTDDCTVSPVRYWINNQTWHKRYFEQDSLVREDFERGKSSEENPIHKRFRSMPGFHHLKHFFARKRSSSSLRRKPSTRPSSVHTGSDQMPREVKSAQYRTVEYKIGLEQKGSYMSKSRDGCDDEFVEQLLSSAQILPQYSLFHDDTFEKTCAKIQDRNETMVIRDISLLIVPSAQTLATCGAVHLDHLFECVNEGWNSAIPFHGTRPQPDYSVGFARSAFTEEQNQKLEPFVGEIGSKLLTYFMATTRMYFPFFTCEIKCGASALDIADRQNAHSMTVAIKGVVELYRAIKQEKKLHRKILGFSISHDDRMVRIYGHYTIIKGERPTFHRHPIHEYSFVALNGRDRWLAYVFTKNVYDIWVPSHFERICSAIDRLPSAAELEKSESQKDGLSSYELSNVASEPMQVRGSEDDISNFDCGSAMAGSQDVNYVTSTTSFTRPSQTTSKKQKR